MVRFLIYASVISADWPEADFVALDRQNHARNQPLGIGSRLVRAHGHFVQILEGPAAAVSALFDRIRTDRRHHSIVTILDRQATGRAFPEIMVPPPAGSAEAPPDEANPPDRDEMIEPSRLLDLMASPTSGPIRESLRVLPRQLRAIETVDRLLLAVERLVSRHGPNKLSVREVALEANVTTQTAYRYFQHTDDLLRVLVSRRQTVALHRIRDSLTQGRFTDERHLAETMIEFLLGALQKKRAMPEAFWQYILRRHHDFQYDELWSLAQVTLAAMQRSGLACAHITTLEIATGIMAAVGAAKGIALRDVAFFREPACRAMLIGLFLSPLGSIARTNRPMG